MEGCTVYYIILPDISFMATFASINVIFIVYWFTRLPIKQKIPSSIPGGDTNPFGAAKNLPNHAHGGANPPWRRTPCVKGSS